MRPHLSSLVAASLALLVGAAAQTPVAAAADAVWTPALAAAADNAQPSGASAAPGLGAAAGALAAPPLLAAVGMQAAAAEPTLPTGEDRAPEAAPRDETERWVPSLAFTSTILGQEADGSVNTTSSVTYNYYMRYERQAVATAFPNNPTPTSCETAQPSIVRITRSLIEENQGGDAFQLPTIQNGNLKPGPSGCKRFTASVFNRPDTVLPVSGSGLNLTPVMGLSAEVMSPGLQALPGRPRLFAHGDVDAAFSFDRNVAKQAVPTSPRLDANIDPTTETAEESNWLGTGARTSGQVKTFMYSGGLGVAFTLDALERRLRIKPSVEYMHQDIKVSGQYLKVFRVDSGLIPGLNPGGPGGSITTFMPSVFLDPIQLQPSTTQGFHGVGPGLELEMDAARAGPVILSLFMTGSAYRMLGDLDVHTTGTQVIPATPPYTTTDQTVSAEFDYSIHAWAYRGGAGMRFRWLPED